MIGLLYTPITIGLLVYSEYRLYSTVSSTISIFTSLSLNLNSNYIHFYANFKKKNDEKLWLTHRRGSLA